MSGVLATLRPWQVVPPQHALERTFGVGGAALGHGLRAARSQQKRDHRREQQDKPADAHRDVSADA